MASARRLVPPLLRQLAGDPLALGNAAQSARSAELVPRTKTADRVVQSVCPYCAVGCGQKVYVKDEKVTQIEGDPDSPVSRGRLCPKGAASEKLVNSPSRETKVKYRPPRGTQWQELSLEQASEMIADRVIRARAETWEDETEDGKPLKRTLGIHWLGGATLDTEENYLIKKLFTAAGAIAIENQARIGHSSTVPGLGTSFGRGGATGFQQDLQNSDCILIMGSNMAEQHPVGFQWVVEAKERGAKVIHVDPRFTRTSAMADLHVPIRPGTDIAFLGGIVTYIFETGSWFREYVEHYTNGPVLLKPDLQDTEDAAGFFSGWNPETGAYQRGTWSYAGTSAEAAAGKSEQHADVSGEQAHGAHGMKLEGGRPPETDPSMEAERCVLQVVRRHFQRYTPEMVSEVCGCTPEQFVTVAKALCENSGRERTSAICYAVGWTQHTHGVQNIRAASIIQLLLGNIGRPGGGILALRGHANIQGSTDIPTLYDILPGYIPMPHPNSADSLEEYIDKNGPDTGAWGSLKSYVVSLLKAWWGDAATAENDFAVHYLPRIDGDHSHYPMMLRMIDGKTKGFIVVGQNPAVGSANAALQRKALANLDWLVVRDTNE